MLKQEIKNSCLWTSIIKKEIGEEVHISLGMNIDAFTESIPLTVIVKYFGQQVGTRMYGEDGDYGI